MQVGTRSADVRYIPHQLSNADENAHMTPVTAFVSGEPWMGFVDTMIKSIEFARTLARAAYLSRGAGACQSISPLDPRRTPSLHPL